MAEYHVGCGMTGDLISRKALVKALIEERDKFPPETVERYTCGAKVPNLFNQAVRGGIRKGLRLVETAPAVAIAITSTSFSYFVI